LVEGKLHQSWHLLAPRQHGDKIRRGYMSRWDMFLKHAFNPIYDLRRNSHGVLEIDGNKQNSKESSIAISVRGRKTRTLLANNYTPKIPKRKL
jgi:hypothetical protein